MAPRVPYSLIGIAVATLVAHFSDLGLVTLGHLPSTLPAPSLGFVDLGAVSVLATAALAIAALAALESLLSATVADAMTVNERHDPDRELFGQGVANIVVPMFGGIPATAAIARTAVNVRAGAGSRLAAVSHALILLVLVFVAAPAGVVDPAGRVGRRALRDLRADGRDELAGRPRPIDPRRTA